jgi:hypothetical protein
MANYYVTISPIDTLSTSTYSIYFDEIKTSNLLFSGVPQSTLVAGFLVYFTGSAASATSVYVKNEDPDCCCAVKSYIFPTPSPTTAPTTASPTTASPTTPNPTTPNPTTPNPTTPQPTTPNPTTPQPTTPNPTTLPPSTPNPTSLECASKEYRINNTTGTDVYWGGTDCIGNSIGGTVGAYTIGNTPCVKDGTFTYSGFPTVTVLSIC